MAPAAGGVWFSTHVPQHPAIFEVDSGGHSFTPLSRFSENISTNRFDITALDQ